MGSRFWTVFTEPPYFNKPIKLKDSFHCFIIFRKPKEIMICLQYMHVCPFIFLHKTLYLIHDDIFTKFAENLLLFLPCAEDNCM